MLLGLECLGNDDLENNDLVNDDLENDTSIGYYIFLPMVLRAHAFGAQSSAKTQKNPF